MDDLVERLLEALPDITGKSYYWGGLVKKAADALAARDAEIAELREGANSVVGLSNSWKAENARLKALLEEAVGTLQLIEQYPAQSPQVLELRRKARTMLAKLENREPPTAPE